MSRKGFSNSDLAITTSDKCYRGKMFLFMGYIDPKTPVDLNARV